MAAVTRVLQIACADADPNPVVQGVKAFPVAKLILLYEERSNHASQEILERLLPLKVEVDRRVIQEPPLTGVLAAMSHIVKEEALDYDDVIVNVSSSDKMLYCSLLSGAFVNGLHAIAIQDGEPQQLPVLKFAYSEMISESKMAILRALERAGGAVDSLNTLSEMSAVEKSLLSYHIRGGRDAKGLEELKLVSIERAKQGRLMVQLTEMGRLILIGNQPAPARGAKSAVTSPAAR